MAWVPEERVCLARQLVERCEIPGMKNGSGGELWRKQRGGNNLQRYSTNMEIRPLADRVLQGNEAGMMICDTVLGRQATLLVPN